MENDILKTEGILEELESFCEDHNFTLLEGIVSFCEFKEMEVETIGALIKKNPILRDKLYLEAQNLKLVKKTANLINFCL